MNFRRWLCGKFGLCAGHEGLKCWCDRHDEVVGRERRITDSNSLDRQRHLTVVPKRKELPPPPPKVTDKGYSPDEFGDDREYFGDEWERDDNV